MSRLAQARSRLGEHYRLGLGAKVEALRLKRKALGGEDAEAAGAVRRMAHQLRGSGASFGHPRISDHAAAVEDAEDGRLAGALDELIEELRRTIEVISSGEKTSILIVEDDAELIQMLEQTLAAPDRRIHSAATNAAAVALLETTPLDLVVLDLALPDGDGRNLLASLHDRPQTADVPVIVLSATAAQQTKTECLALGAEQYLEKPFEAELVSAIVSGILLRRRRHSDEVRVDALTGLANRAGFREQFERAVKLGSRAGLPLALAILDLDHFKKFNDSYGHNAGDAVLSKTGAVLTEALRQTDLPARWGGEEFVVLFQNTRAGVALTVLRKLQDELRAATVESDGNQLPVMTFSGGVVDVALDEELDTALSRADKLLYHAKRAGRDCVLDEVPDGTLEPTPSILLAEDDDNVAGLVIATLESEGFAVSRCADGQSAITAALASPYKLVILDKVMPELDGFDVLRRIRAEAADTSTPVLMLTGVGREDEIERAFDLGADDYVQKPFKTRELIARVRRLLRRQER